MFISAFFVGARYLLPIYTCTLLYRSCQSDVLRAQGRTSHFILVLKKKKKHCTIFKSRRLLLRAHQNGASTHLSSHHSPELVKGDEPVVVGVGGANKLVNLLRVSGVEMLMKSLAAMLHAYC